MKTNYKYKKTQFNFVVDKEDYETIKNLREKYAINISGAFKIFLKQLNDKLEKLDQIDK